MSQEPWYVTSYGEDYYQAYKDQFSEKETAAEVDGIVRLLELAPGARVLDVCCGFGRHSIALARRGFQVTGLDLSPHLLAHARAGADQAGVHVDWIEADMRDIPLPVVPYEAVVCLFSSLGVLGTDDEELRVVQAMGRALAPGGSLLIDTVNREVMLRRWMPQRWREGEDGVLICDKMRFDVLTGILHLEEITVPPDGVRARTAHQLRLWAFTELKQLLGMAGIGPATAHGGLDGSAYTWDAYRMVVLGRKA